MADRHVRPVPSTDERSISRHVVGRIAVAEVGDVLEAARSRDLPTPFGARSIGGAESLDRTDRPLFLGMVIGDDRDQSATTADDFRAAGLGHLLVVSGQNVAFVLAVAMPVVGRFRPAGRAVTLFAILGLFAVTTRFEPSVLRATAMAGFGIGSAALGRPVDGRVGLSWACAGLLVVDPFLVRVVAFQLSAAGHRWHRLVRGPTCRTTARTAVATGPAQHNRRGPARRIAYLYPSSVRSPWASGSEPAGRAGKRGP